LLGTRLRLWRTRGLLRLLVGRVSARAVLIDVGAGPGFAAVDLARLLGADGTSWLLADPQRMMFTRGRGARARARGAPKATLVVADAAALPVRSSSVDVVLSLGVVCCMADAAVPAAIAETLRVLKPGGLLLFGVPARRGTVDDARWRSAGLVPVVSLRPGRGLFQKAL
jgi:SAM-dependent methyltransferase